MLVVQSLIGWGQGRSRRIGFPFNEKRNQALFKGTGVLQQPWFSSCAPDYRLFFYRKLS